MKNYLERYLALMKHDEATLQAWADETLPGGGLGAYALADDVRFVFSHGKGARFYDCDGDEYIDYTGGAGALLLGHSHPAIIDAAQAQLQAGMHMFGTVNKQAVLLAKRLVQDLPCAEKIAYATTGGEATAYAMRMARASTGREKIIKFEGGYHGNHDYALVSTFPAQTGNYPYGSADTGGQPQAVRDTMLICPYNDVAMLRSIMAEYKGQVAAIIVEAVQRIIPAQPEFLACIRQLCDEYDSVMILDEVVTGFRLAYGGAQEYYGIKPDLACYGKVIGASGPLSVIAGKAELINLANPRKKGDADATYFNGTLHGNPVAAAATLASLDVLQQQGVYQQLNDYADEFCQQAQKILDKYNIPAIAANVGSLWQFLFMDKMPSCYQDIANSDMVSARRLDAELLKRKHYMLPGVRRFFSTTHGDAEMEETLRDLDDICQQWH